MMMKRVKITNSSLLIPLFLALVWINPASAQVTTPSNPTDDQVNAIAKQLYCPVCENIPLDVCGTKACAQWRDLIRLRLAEGWTETQIKQYFVDQYGDRVLAIPPAHGLNWLVYFVPPLAILIGVFVLYRALYSWKRHGSKSKPDENLSKPKDEYIQRIEEELRKR
jgi:cytochrome c-type biogenesis protein CcmH